jgi:tripartite-type tricarboxylate transporter receptor subunit TctC
LFPIVWFFYEAAHRSFMENHKSDGLRVVAVMGVRRQLAAHDVPTFAERGQPALRTRVITTFMRQAAGSRSS